jgi:large subunit ribosomal protein LP2
MRYAAAYVLATLAGNANPDVSTISKILGSVGVDCDNAKAQKVIDACKGKNVDQIIEEGTKKLSTLPTAGPAAASTGAAAAPAAAADAKKGGAKEEPKKEEKKKAESDDEGDDMVCHINKKDFVLINFIFFYLGIWLIRLNLLNNKQITHRHHSDLSREVFLFVCYKKENNQSLTSIRIKFC